MDVNAVRDDVMNYLRLTALTDRKRVERAIVSTIDYILTYHHWSFLEGEDTISVSSTTNEYTVGRDDFLFPIPGSMGYADGKISIIAQSYLRSLYSDLSDLTVLEFAVFTGKTVKFYSVEYLSSAVDVHYSYQRTGMPDDLDVDPAFVEIVKNGTIKSVAKGGTPAQLSAQGLFQSQLRLKKSIWSRHYEGESQMLPEERHTLFQAVRRSLRED